MMISIISFLIYYNGLAVPYSVIVIVPVTIAHTLRPTENQALPSQHTAPSYIIQ